MAPHLVASMPKPAVTVIWTGGDMVFFSVLYTQYMSGNDWDGWEKRSAL